MTDLRKVMLEDSSDVTSLQKLYAVTSVLSGASRATSASRQINLVRIISASIRPIYCTNVNWRSEQSWRKRPVCGSSSYAH